MPRSSGATPSSVANRSSSSPSASALVRTPEPLNRCDCRLRAAATRLEIPAVRHRTVFAACGPSQGEELAGQMAVDLLVDMLHRNEKGVPLLPQQLLIDGSWNEGRTLRPVTPLPLTEPALASA